MLHSKKWNLMKYTNSYSVIIWCSWWRVRFLADYCQSSINALPQCKYGIHTMGTVNGRASVSEKVRVASSIGYWHGWLCNTQSHWCCYPTVTFWKKEAAHRWAYIESTTHNRKLVSFPEQKKVTNKLIVQCIRLVVVHREHIHHLAVVLSPMVEAKIVSESMNICQHNDAQIERKSSTYSALFIIQMENSNSFELLHYLLVDLRCSVNRTRWAYQFVLAPASEFSCIGRLRYRTITAAEKTITATRMVYMVLTRIWERTD